MGDTSEKSGHSKIRLIYLLPNMLTIAAICAGLTAIRLGYEGSFEMAVFLVLVACILDGLDGRIARLLNQSTEVGAELDSLADFLNFGVAPVLILHSWALTDFASLAWIAVLFYTVCCVLRLARFNVSGRMDTENKPSDVFVGVPSPAGAVLVLLPMFVAFAFPYFATSSPLIVTMHIFAIGLLMVSRIPTPSFKNTAVSRANATFFMLGAAVLAAALLTYFWATLVFLALFYTLTVLWACRIFFQSSQTDV